MQQTISPKEAVRLAKEKLGIVENKELAVYIQDTWGLTIKPPIITVLLGSLQERANLDQSGQVAREKIEQWKAENPEEAKKLASTVQKREAARRRKEAAARAAQSTSEQESPASPTLLPSVSTNSQETTAVEIVPGQAEGDAVPELPIIV